MEKALAALPGVANVQADSDSKTAIVTLKGEEFNVEQALASLADAGFGGSSLHQVLPEDDAPASNE